MEITLCTSSWQALSYSIIFDAENDAVTQSLEGADK